MTQWIITSSVLILIIAVLRFVLRGKISLKLQYALWGLVLIRLLLPFSVFESPASVLNLMKEREETFEPPVYYEPYAPGTINPGVPDDDIYILDDYVEQIAPETNITIDKEGFVTEPEIKVFDWGDVLMGVWLVGTAAFGAVFAVSNLRFRKKLKNTREYVSGTKAWLPVYESSAVKTPCLFGAAKPAIYITKGVLADEKVLSHVLEHETTHYRHGEHVWSVLRCFCLALHWYNPLVWLAAFLSMRDSELACDEDTIKRIGEEERIGYGRTLINLTCEKPAVGILSAATTMTGSKSSIKERILLIAKKPKMLWITAVLVAVVAIFAVGCTFTGAKDASEMKEDKKVIVESSIEGNENIVPVLYYEKGVGGPSYKTNTLLINDNKAFVMENHNRTFERTYPSSAYERFKENEAVYGEYGQLMVYYNSVFGEIFLFESYDERIFTIVKNNIKTEINFNEGETYFDFLYFDGNYYLFTLTETSVLRTYKISENLEVEKPFDFKYGNLDIDETVFIDNSVVIVGNNLVLTSEKDLVICNFETNVTKVLPMDYSVFGMVADKDCFYVISYSDLGEIVFEKFSPEGESLGKNEIFLPSGFNYSPWISRTDGTYYMYGSEIYMEFHTGGECYIFSYDVESEEWKNSWIVGKEKEPFSASNIKYMVMSGETYYDIFPYWSNRENNNINNDAALEAEILEKAKTAINTSGADINSFKLEILDVESEKVPYEIIHYYFDGCGNRKYTVPVVGFSDGEIILVHLIRENEAVIHRFEENFDGEYEHKEDIPVEYDPIPQSSYYPIYTTEEIASMTEEEFFTAAKKLGYTDEQLEYIGGFIEEGLGREYILMPLECSKETSFLGKTNDSKKSLGTFYYDPEDFGDYGGSLGFAYVINNGKFTVLPEMYFNNLGVVDNEHFAFANDVSIKIYEFENINKPSAEWNLPSEDNTEFGYQLLGTSMNKTVEQIAVFYVDIPDDFDKIYDHKEPDLSSTYQIAVIDTDGNEVYTLDTGINLMVEYQGLPDCVCPEMGITYKNTLRFTLGEKSYEFNFEEKSLEKISPLTNFDSNDERVKEAISYIEYIVKKSGNSIISIEFSTERTDLEIEYLARYYDKEMLKDNIIHIEATYLDESGAEDWTSYVLSYTELDGPHATGNFRDKYREEFGTQWYIINSGKP